MPTNPSPSAVCDMPIGATVHPGNMLSVLRSWHLEAHPSVMVDVHTGAASFPTHLIASCFSCLAPSHSLFPNQLNPWQLQLFVSRSVH